MNAEKTRAEISEWNKLSSDVERWRWLAANPNTELAVMLDNDDTFLALPYVSGLPDDEQSQRDDLNDSITNRFDEFIGNAPGISDLLDAFGVPSEHV